MEQNPYVYNILRSVEVGTTTVKDWEEFVAREDKGAGPGDFLSRETYEAAVEALVILQQSNKI